MKKMLRPGCRWIVDRWQRGVGDLGSRKTACVLAAIALGVLAGPRLALGAEEQPQAEALIRKMIDASGGTKAYQQAKSRFTSGKVVVPKMGIEMSLTSWSQRPNRTYVLMESPSLGRMESGCDGATVWENSAMQGPNLKKGTERALHLREADFESWPNWKTYYRSATTLGADSVGGAATWKVEMVPLEGSPETVWFDRATGLLLKTSMTIQTDMGDVPVDTFFEDHREVCGTTLPFRTRQVMIGGVQEMVSIIDSVACNPDVPGDRFVLPAEIKALVEKSPAKGASPADGGEKPPGN